MGWAFVTLISMKQLKAIVPKTGPRIILSVTTDANPQVGDNAEAVDIPQEPDFTSGSRYKILNPDSSFRDATDQEIDDADVDPDKRMQKRKRQLLQLKDAMVSLLADDTVPQTVKDFVTALKHLY